MPGSFPNRRLLDWIRKKSSDLTADGTITKLELWHAVDGDGAERLTTIYSQDRDPDEEPDDLCQELWDEAEQDAETRAQGSHQRYVVQAYRGEDNEPEESKSFVIIGRAVSSHLGGMTESPTARGLLSQEMRHTDTAYGLLMRNCEASTGALGKQLEAERRENTRLRGAGFELEKLRQDLLDRKADRERDLRKEEKAEERWGTVLTIGQSLLPMLAARFLGPGPAAAAAAMAGAAAPPAMGPGAPGGPGGMMPGGGGAMGGGGGPGGMMPGPLAASAAVSGQSGQSGQSDPSDPSDPNDLSGNSGQSDNSGQSGQAPGGTRAAGGPEESTGAHPHHPHQVQQQRQVQQAVHRDAAVGNLLESLQPAQVQALLGVLNEEQSMGLMGVYSSFSQQAEQRKAARAQADVHRAQQDVKATAAAQAAAEAATADCESREHDNTPRSEHDNAEHSEHANTGANHADVH